MERRQQYSNSIRYAGQDHVHVPLLCPRKVHYKLPSVVLSVRLSVSLWRASSHRHNSRTKRPRKPKIGRMKSHHMCIQQTYLEVKRSKVKVTKPINAHTVNVQYLPNRKAYELQTCYTDGARRPASVTSAVTFKVKGQGRKVT